MFNRLQPIRGPSRGLLKVARRYYSTGDDPKFTSPSAALQLLPSVEDSEFRIVIEKKKVYVDKTSFLNLILEEDRKFFFLSRPRRFGKTLFVDMMNEFFNGEKELFEGTLIYKERFEHKWPTYPVIRIDFTKGVSSRTVEKFEADLTMKLKRIAELNRIYDINENMSPESALDILIETLKNKTRLGVVILIDEYDAPYSTNYDKPQASAMLEVIQSFFRVIKAQRPNIHMMFFTGSSRMAISEFFTTTTSLDLSMKPEYSAIMGFSSEELKQYFHGHINHVARSRNETVDTIYAEMKRWHDGFEFTGSGLQVYNPCSVINYLTTEGRDKLFWSESGGLSSLLMKKFSELPHSAYDHILRYATSNIRPEGNEELNPLIAPKSHLTGSLYLADNSVQKLTAILYQSGYLSIDKRCNECGEEEEPEYILRFTNLEVEIDYVKRLSQILFKAEMSELGERLRALSSALESCEWELFINRLESILAATPYLLYTSKKTIEAMFQFQLHVLMYQCGYKPDTETMTSSGRSDIAIITPIVAYILEIKLEKNLQNPLDQCRDKYLRKYTNYKREIFCIGLKFSQQAKVTSWGVAHFSKSGQLVKEYGMIKLTK